MLIIYNEKNALSFIGARGCQSRSARTFIPIPSVNSFLFSTVYPSSSRNSYAFATCPNLEVLKWAFTQSIDTVEDEKKLVLSSDISYMFLNSSKLIKVYPLDVSGVRVATNAFFGCTSLQELRLFGLAINVSIDSSERLSKNSVLYIINNSAPKSAITIILHPDAYTHLAEDADIVAALEAQPLISLVSA